jgi:catechol 2,3-dioxygenase-like lactoylglutathione lyase family enzyme
VDLFAGIPVTDFATGRDWWQRLFGAEPAFYPHDTEAVWRVGEHRFLYVMEDPARAGHAVHTLFVEDLDREVGGIAERGLEPVERETYSNGVRKITYRDPDGNEIGFGGAPLEG